MKHFLSHLQAQVAARPDAKVLTDYETPISYTYRTLVEDMARVNILLDDLGLQAGDKVALCGRNSSHWGVAFMALMASRRIAVSILPDFTAEGIRSLVAHSEAKILMVGDVVWSHIKDEGIRDDVQATGTLQAIISLVDFQPLALADEQMQQAFEKNKQHYEARFPDGMCHEMTDWNLTIDDSLAMINYTSGTTSSPKGVMLTNRNISANVEQVFGLVDVTPGETIVSILPLAHMYGLCIEFISCMALGIHIHFIQRNPTPTVLAKALNDIHPCALVCVPLVLEKVFRKSVLPIVKKPLMRMLMRIPGINTLLGNKIRKTIIDAMGGNIRYYVIGGAALNQEVEEWMSRLKMPYIVGYGMTECGPLIAVSRVGSFPKNSCGRQVPGMEIRIDSEDPTNVAGEILTHGTNQMLGYYKNDEATRNTFTKDGWLRTGDLGVLDANGNLFIKGRNKSMILGPSGQNIYPEEIEDKLNGLPGIAESLVVEREGKLVALIYCDPVFTRKLGGLEHHKKLIEQRLKRINRGLPAYSQIAHLEFVEQEFEKTPKRSIKRFLYA